MDFERFKNLNEEQTKLLLPKGLILLGYRGSLAHGTWMKPTDPNSVDDKDLMGVFIPGLTHYLGLQQKEHHEAFINEWDSVSYELRQFVRLLDKSNPNVLSLLWMDDKHYLARTHAGNRLIENRELFMSKRIYHSFCGYGKAQFHKMTAFSDQGYMGLKRKQLVEKFGYDVKNAAHCIRILRMGIEALREGVFHVFREDAPELLDIKNGRWSIEQVKEEAARLFKRAEDAYDQCNLPAEPQHYKINALLIDILREEFATRNWENV